MRLVGNARARRIGLAPTPLEICPGRQIWEQQRNREYLLFIDESFYRFFGFADEDGFRPLVNVNEEGQSRA